MNRLEFTKLSLRDLAMLVQLVEKRRIAPVALDFRVSQSAVSYALDRLRGALGNELLIRTHNGFRPTQQAHLYAGQAKRFLSQFEAIRTPEVFDPADAACTLTIVATEYEISGPFRPVFEKILAEGPGIQLRTIQTSSNLSVERLHEDFDLVFAPLPLEMAGIEQLPLYADPYRVFFDPVCGFDGSIDSYCAARHALVDSNGKPHSEVDRLLDQQGRRRQVSLVTPSFTVLADLMRGKPLLATLPAGFGRGPLRGFEQLPPPFEIPPMPLSICYSRSKKSDPKLQWLIEVILRCNAERAGQSEVLRR